MHQREKFQDGQALERQQGNELLLRVELGLMLI